MERRIGKQEERSRGGEDRRRVREQEKRKVV